MKEQLILHHAPAEVIRNYSFSVRVRLAGGEWQEIVPWSVRVDMHNRREASMVSFEFQGKVEMEVRMLDGFLHTAKVRPASQGVTLQQEGEVVTLTIEKPGKVSLEVNGDIFHNLHIFADEIEQQWKNFAEDRTAYPAEGKLKEQDILDYYAQGAEVIFFRKGYYEVEEKELHIPSGKILYLEGGAALRATLRCEEVEHVRILGRGAVYFYNEPWRHYQPTAYFKRSSDIEINGIIAVNPCTGTVGVGNCNNVRIENIKSFSCNPWSDGINFFCSEDCYVNNVFMRNSDDCVTVYGSRGEFRGDSRNILVENSSLWADVAHPILIGTHGDHEHDGDTLEELTFRNIDILNHHEVQENYLGCMAINAGDKNKVKHVLFEDIRVDDFEEGRLIDVRVFWNKDYNPAPGKGIEQVTFRNVTYDGRNEIPSQVWGFSEEFSVKDIRFENLIINGNKIHSPEEGNFKIGEYAEDITFA